METEYQPKKQLINESVVYKIQPTESLKDLMNKFFTLIDKDEPLDVNAGTLGAIPKHPQSNGIIHPHKSGGGRGRGNSQSNRRPGHSSTMEDIESKRQSNWILRPSMEDNEDPTPNPGPSKPMGMGRMENIEDPTPNLGPSKPMGRGRKKSLRNEHQNPDDTPPGKQINSIQTFTDPFPKAHTTIKNYANCNGTYIIN